MTSQELKAYAKAGAIAEEVFSSIRTVFSYNGTVYESKRSEIVINLLRISLEVLEYFLIDTKSIYDQLE